MLENPRKLKIHQNLLALFVKITKFLEFYKKITIKTIVFSNSDKSYLFYFAQMSGRLPGDHPVKWRGDSALNDCRDHAADLRYLKIVENPKGSSEIQETLRKYYKILKNLRNSQKILENTKNFQNILRNPRKC